MPLTDIPLHPLMGCDRIETPAQLDQALKRRQELRAEHAKLQAAHKQDIDDLLTEYANLATVEISLGDAGTERIPIAAAVAAIDQAVRDYAERNRATLFAKAKTFKTGRGDLKFVQPATKLDIANEKQVAALLSEPLLQELTALLDRHNCRHWLRVKFEVDQVGILAEYKAGRITKELLQKHGITVTTPEENFNIK